MQRIISDERFLYQMQHNDDGTGQQLFALNDRGDYVDVRVATSRNSYSTMVMSPDVALAAYQWLGQWLQAQGVQLPPQPQLSSRR